MGRPRGESVTNNFKKNSKKMALWNSFSIDMKFKMLVRSGGDRAGPPHTTPPLNDDDVALDLELSHQASHSGWGETPLSV